jgi:ribose-phosphate pyrophosphokinase
MVNPLVFAFPADRKFGAAIAALVGGENGQIALHTFPDGEVLVRLDTPCAGREVMFVCGGHDPNTLALPLYFAATTARDLGAVRVGLVSPYLAYMRQDKRFQEGESLSASAYARFLESSFDWLVTVEAHLHRYRSLGEVFAIPASNVSASEALIPWIRAHVADPVLVGPDRESAQWTVNLAARLGAPVTVLDKVRSGDRSVTVSVPEPGLVCGHTPVIVDDIASSGRTLARAIEVLLGVGANAPVCIVVHALFAGDALQVIGEAGASRVVSANTIEHATNQIDVAPLVAAAVRAHLSTTPRPSRSASAGSR